MKEKLRFAHMGNGVTVCDESQEKNSDYLTLAHISYNREVTFYTESISQEAKAEIVLFARTKNMSASVTQDYLVLKPVQLSEIEDKLENQAKETRVVNIKKEKYDVYIGRAGKGQDGYFGNPFRLEPGCKPGSTLEQYEKYFYNRLNSDIEFKNKIHAVKGKTLGCFCKPSPCHGDIIKEYLDTIHESTLKIK